MFIYNAGYAQNTGKITGKITDQKSGESLIGATVLVQLNSKGASANVDGEYILTLPAGTYTLMVKYVGYQNKLISDVKVAAGKVTNLNVVLAESKSQTLNEVTIRATFKQESVNSLYAAQKNNAAVTDGITAETIKRSPDKSASEVLRRVSGATIQDNKFVVVRGLSDRYNNAMLDGTSLPSTEPNRKAFSFDIVPANLIDNIIINKTATPNLPGDFAGGAVQIVTKDIPDENFISINAGLGYNTNTTFKDFQSGYRNLSDYFGFDNGSRKLPSNFPSTATLTSTNGLSNQQSIAPLKSLNSNFNVYHLTAAPNQNYQLSAGLVKDIGKNGNRFGAIFALTYRNSLQTIQNGTIDYNVYQYNDTKYKFSTSVGALANFAYSYGKNRITFKNIYNRTFDDLYLYRTGYNESTSFPDNHFTAFDLVEKGLYKGTLQGDHGLAGNSKLTWVGSFSNFTNNQPDQRKTNYALKGNVYSADNGSVGKQNARYFADLNENIISGQADYSLPVNFFKQKATFKLGAASQYRDRSFTPRFIGPYINSSDPEALATSDLPLNQIFSKSVIDKGYYKLTEITSLKDAYTANTLTNAGYAMLDNKFGDKTRLVWGLRVEKFDLHLNDRDATTTETRLNDLNFLPSANFTYNITPKSNFRLSYSRTVARPELRELSETGYFDFELLATVIGSKTLKSTQIQNFDIRYELYPSAGQIISISGFYKNFNNAIEQTIDDQVSTPIISYFNVQRANNLGVEFELRKTLDFISPSLKNTTFYTNLALISSKVIDDNKSKLPNGSRPMVGQAPYVINMGLLQTAFNNKLSANVLYNRVGKRIFAAGIQYPSVYENPRDVLDVQLAYKVFKNKGEFKLNASDLLNQNTLFYYKESVATYSLAQGSILNRYKTGSTFTLSYSYTF
ncbi:TonB-dependent receptor plug [Mucilaginibacter paludis DSM 18603]|uniref:TonB-dependent receptor plug n=1 Tax=Mucilaginibacter paludis DSM 18603 TaxID=714943 RepID=H1Y290_9SPHI|nr:TonB-dependent receptor plug [Mucilaginibacter paludis DSM 18603]